MKDNLRYFWPLHFVLMFTNWFPDNVIFLRIRGYLASPFFGKCGRDLRLGRNLTFYNCKNIQIGNHVYIAKSNWFSAGEKIIIDDEVIFGPHSVISAANHTRKNQSFRYGEPNRKPINIKKGSWIAANCTLVAGSTIGRGSLIAANTVVNSSIPDNVIFSGNPGKIVKNL